MKRSLTTEAAGAAPDAIVNEHLSARVCADAVGAAHGALERFFARIEEAAPGRVDGEWRAELATAVGEMLGNIAIHAYPPETADRGFDLDLRLYPDRVEARFADAGTPYAPAPPAPPSTEPDIAVLAESGRGLELIRLTVDELKYSR